MRGDDHPFAEGPGEVVQDLDEPGEVPRGVNVLLAMQLTRK